MKQKSQGSISAFIVCLTMSLLLLVGFVYDGGRITSRYAEISDMAENAARIGAQQVVGIRAGKPHIDEEAARRRITTYLQENGVQGRLLIRDGGAVVVISSSVPMHFLSLIGVRERQLRVTRIAQVVKG